MAKQNQSAQANNKTQIQLKAADKATLTIPASQHLEQATKSADGAITIKQSMGALKLVDVADVDLLLTFANGEHVIIPHGAIDAVGKNPPDALFSDSKISLPELFKLVGVTNPAKAGSLRLVSENIDANPPTDENVSHDEHIPDTPPPPAPMLKVGAGQGAGKSLGTGLGSVPETYTPLVTAQPSVYRVGKSSAATLSDIIKGTPNFDAALFTSNEFKVTPAVTDNIPGIPQGAYQSSLSALQLASRTSPEYQSTREVINVVGTDIVNHNTSFVADSNQWAKTLHAAINNFSTIDSITFTINVGGAAELAAANANLNLVGAGINATSPFSWTMTPPADPSAGFDIQMLYDLNTNVTANFVLNVNVKGTSGPVTLDYTKQLYFTYRDVDANQTDFTVTDPSTGNQMMVLPSAGLGIEFRGDSANNEIHAGAGNDWIFGNAGDDILYGDTGDDILYGGLGGDELYGGVGSDTASYRYAAATSGTTGVVASLSTPANNTGEAGGDRYRDNSIENLIGSTYNDTLEGNAAKNTLIGLAGDDTLIGVGFGNILDGGGYEIDGTRIQNDGNDTVSYVGTSSTINIDASLSRGTGYNTAQPSIKDEYTNIENLTGGDGNDTLEGNSFGNVLDGGAGNDTVTFANASATDTQIGTGVFATLMQDSNQAYLNLTQGTGAAAGDTYINIENLTGSAFNDILEGNASANKFDGGLGNDTVSYENSANSVTASLIAPNNNTGDALGDTYFSIENLKGSSRDDILEGNAGANQFTGGGGVDTVSYAHSSTGVNVSLITDPTIISNFSVSGDASGDVFIDIANLTGSYYNDKLIGNNSVNTLSGGAGDDVLEGMGGADILIGGTGSNTASYEHYVSSNGKGVIASLEADASKMIANSSTVTINEITYVTKAGVIYGTLTGANVDNPNILNDATGDTYTNIQNLVGSGAADILTGSYTQSSTTTVDTSNIYGNAGDDTIYTSLIGNTNIYGGTGNDTVIVTKYIDNKQDILDGGEGTGDTFIYNGDVIVYSLDMGRDGQGTFSPNNIRDYANPTGGPLGGLGAYVTLKNFENITINNGGYGGTIYASNADNIITVTSATNKTINYQYAGSSGVTVDLSNTTSPNVSGGSGNDTISGFDNVSGSAYGDSITGNNSNNYLYGGGGADKLYGGGGNDNLEGGAGADAIYGDTGTDQVTYYNSGGAVKVDLSNNSTNAQVGDAQGDTFYGIENIQGSNGYGDALVGDNNQNTISGLGGNDVIQGLKNDTISGDGGDDILRISATPGAMAAYAWGGSNNTSPGSGVIGDMLEISNLGQTFNITSLVNTSNNGVSTQVREIETINMRETSFSTALNFSQGNSVPSSNTNTNMSIDSATLKLITSSTSAPTINIMANSGDTLTLSNLQTLSNPNGEHWASGFDAAISNIYTISNASNQTLAIINWQVA